MYSVFLSKIEKSIELVKDELIKILPKDPIVAVFPWAFPYEIDSERLENDYFKKGGNRYNRYINSLKLVGIKEENIIICNCYSDSTDKLKSIIRKSNILLLPGGNPEMLYKKVVLDTEILYEIKHYSGLIIGESAGTELQLKRYFITAKNNYYNYFAFYDGFGIIDNSFYIDVHTSNNIKYLEKLQKVSNETSKEVYAIYDNGAIVYDRNNNKFSLFGCVKIFQPNNN